MSALREAGSKAESMVAWVLTTGSWTMYWFGMTSSAPLTVIDPMRSVDRTRRPENILSRDSTAKLLSKDDRMWGML